MQHLTRPVSAGEQLSLAPEPTGPSPTDGPPTPARPRSDDAIEPAASTSAAPAATVTPAGNALALARLIAEGRRPRSRRFAELEPYRDVLLAERRTGASIRLLAQSLAKLDVTVAEETLRVWLLRQKMPKRRRSRKKSAVPVTANLGAATIPRFAPALYPKPELPRRSPRIARDDL